MIVGVLEKNIESVEVCQGGCRAIWNTVDRAASQAVAKDSGVIEISVKAMRNHITDEDINESCCSIIWKITNDRKY